MPMIHASYGVFNVTAITDSYALSLLDALPMCSTTYTHTAASTPASYPTSCSGGVSGNYSFSYHDGSFQVGKQPLDATASSPSAGVYGDLVPTITASYGGAGLNGFVYGHAGRRT